MAQDQWTKVGADNTENIPVWDYKDPDSVKEIIGTLKRVKTNVGANNSNIYEVEQEDGSMISFWGTTLLDARLKEVLPMSKVKIVYLGKATSDKTKRTYHNFDIFYQEPVW